MHASEGWKKGIVRDSVVIIQATPLTRPLACPVCESDAGIYRRRSIASSFNYGIKKRHSYNGDAVNRIAGTAYAELSANRVKIIVLEVPQNNFLKPHKYGLRSVAFYGNGEAMGDSNTLP